MFTKFHCSVVSLSLVHGAFFFGMLRTRVDDDLALTCGCQVARVRCFVVRVVCGRGSGVQSVV